MIPYEELCDAIVRWRARQAGEEAPAPAPDAHAAAPDAPDVYGEPDEGVTPAPMAQETTNEIDIDGVDVVEG
jgi:hypothetical protein